MIKTTETNLEYKMIRIIFFFAASLITPLETTPNIQVDYLEFDAVYLPPNYSGPIVAIPVDDNCFQ